MKLTGTLTESPNTRYTPDKETQNDLAKLYHMLFNGEFYEDYDEGGRLLGILRAHLIDTGVNLLWGTFV